MAAVIERDEVAEVSQLVRTALHARDPIARAEAAARLEAMDLPVSPTAIILAARKDHGR